MSMIMDMMGPSGKASNGIIKCHLKASSNGMGPMPLVHAVASQFQQAHEVLYTTQESGNVGLHAMAIYLYKL